jgi:hypothetical protein
MSASEVRVGDRVRIVVRDDETDPALDGLEGVITEHDDSNASVGEWAVLIDGDNGAMLFYADELVPIPTTEASDGE